jgi:hypothetical protein
MAVQELSPELGIPIMNMVQARFDTDKNSKKWAAPMQYFFHFGAFPQNAFHELAVNQGLKHANQFTDHLARV